MIVSLTMSGRKNISAGYGVLCVPHLAGCAPTSQIFSQAFCLIIKTRNQVALNLMKDAFKNDWKFDN